MKERVVAAGAETTIHGEPDASQAIYTLSSLII